MTHTVPAIGEVRWLLFPTFLFALLRPLLSLGIVHTIEGALIPFALASVLFSVVYLYALRTWLIAQQVDSVRRWVALVLAAVCPPFLTYATDTAEPLFAATLCVVGLAMVAHTKRLALGVFLMSFALLLYQGVFVAFFFLPMTLEWEKLRSPRNLRAAVIVLASVAVATVAILMIRSGISPTEVIRRTFFVFRNPIHRDWMRGGLLKGAAVTVFGGFPQTLVSNPDIHGLKGAFAGLRNGDPVAQGVVLRLALGFILTVLGSMFAYRRRRWEWLLALGGLAILPVIWNNMYGYLKFYILFPVLAAHVVARVSPRVSIPIVGIVALLNLSHVVADVSGGRARYQARSAQYRGATADTRWITSGWEPDFPYLWPGRACGMLASLARPSSGTTLEEVRAESTGHFMTCVQEALCSGQPVWTDDWIQPNAGHIGDIAAYHGLPAHFLDLTLLRGLRDGEAVDVTPGHSLYIYPVGRQSEICNDLRRNSSGFN